MRCYLEFLTTPTADTPGTLLLLHFDDGRYLVGRPGEGTQRACIQRGIGLRKVSDVLLTGWTKWENLGGMLGMVLNLADMKGAASEAHANLEKLQRERRQQENQTTSMVKSKVQTPEEAGPLRFYGAPNLNHLIGTARRFIFRKGMPLAAKEYGGDLKPSESWEPTWSDKRIRVWVMPITPSDAENSKEPSYGSPRKRRFGDISDDDHHIGEEYDSMRRDVVNKMFGSNWRYDALVPMQLSQVEMPATVFVRDPTTKQTVPYTGPLPGDSNYNELSDTTVLVREPWPGALTEFLPPTKSSKDAVSYIIRNHPQRGKFMPDKARELNIYPMSKWNDLSNGHSVENLDGKLITPDMVLQPGKEGGGIAVVDLPTIEHVKPLVERQEWKEKKVMEGVGAIVWILGPGVSTHPSLLAFQRDMSHLEHVVASPDCCPDILTIDSAAKSVLRYSKVDATAFVPLRYATTAEHQLGGGTSPNLDSNGNTTPGVIAATRGLRIGLQPVLGLEYDKIQPPLDIAMAKKQIDEDLELLLDDASLNVEPSQDDIAEWMKEIEHSDVEVITLGTGSSHPSTHRNVSGTLVRVPGSGSYLLDAGEGTLGTLQRIFAPGELAEIFKDLRVIWISHLHADHHLGLTSVIKAWYHAVHNGIPAPTPSALDSNRVMEEKNTLAIISDATMLHWLAEYSSVEDFGYSHILPLATRPGKYFAETHRKVETTLHLSYGMRQANPTEQPAVSNSLVLPKLGLRSFETTYVHHCRGAQAVSLTTSSGFKFSYSGDCRPHSEFAAIGAESHLLIHEATFEDRMRLEALAKRHSTAGEAIVVATQMKAKVCLLTHFSQRYPTMPSWDAPPDANTSSALLALQQPSSANNSHNAHQSRELSPEYRALVGSGRLRETVAQSGMRVITAFDYMRLKMKDVPYLEARQPLLKEVCQQVASKDSEGIADSLSDDVMDDDDNNDTKQQGKASARGNTKGAGGSAAAKAAKKLAKKAQLRENHAKNVANIEGSLKWKRPSRGGNGGGGDGDGGGMSP